MCNGYKKMASNLNKVCTRIANRVPILLFVFKNNPVIAIVIACVETLRIARLSQLLQHCILHINSYCIWRRIN